MSEALVPQSVPRQHSASRAVSAFSTIAVFETAETCSSDWQKLEAVAAVSIYQTRRWLVPWMATIGAERGIRPMLILAYDGEHNPVMLLPLGTVRANGLTIARFLGGKDANFNMALCRPGVEFSAGDLRELLAQAAKAGPRRVDLFHLSNQTESWEGLVNPFAALPRQPSPSFGYKTALAPEPEAFFKQHLSGQARKKLNYKQRKLAEKGVVVLRQPQTSAEIAEVMTAYHTQKAARFMVLGIAGDHDSAGAADFLRAAAESGAANEMCAMEWHALHCGNKIVATFAGGVHRGRLHGMVTSFDMSPDYAAASPGELLIHALLAGACQRGLAAFDLGIGEARYKSTYCDVAEPLFDCLIPASLKGRLMAKAETLRLSLKRHVKQTPWIWAMVLRLRKARATKKGSTPE